jgi:hypothetical protein
MDSIQDPMATLPTITTGLTTTVINAYIDLVFIMRNCLTDIHVLIEMDLPVEVRMMGRAYHQLVEKLTSFPKLQNIHLKIFSDQNVLHCDKYIDICPPSVKKVTITNFLMSPMNRFTIRDCIQMLYNQNSSFNDLSHIKQSSQVKELIIKMKNVNNDLLLYSAKVPFAFAFRAL